MGSSIFHEGLWFDESYSVALARHSFYEIWTIGGHDVHPVLYYFALHILYLIFGSNLIVYRIFSLLGIATLAIIGYTHIRKDFGSKTGIIFSFLSLFLPIMVAYSGEIRMYSWAITLVTLCAIYAYRLLKENSKKNWILFAIFSLASSYTHYYGLVTAGFINLFLYVYIRIYKKEDKTYLKSFITQAIIEVALYIPWLMYFAIQLFHVAGGFWVSVSFPGTLIDILVFHYQGNLTSILGLNARYVILAISVIFYIYILFVALRLKRKNEDIKPAVLSISIYASVILAMAIISFGRPILYDRYIFVITGLLIFTLSYFMARDKNKIITVIILALILIASICNQYIEIKNNYNDSNLDVIAYLSENIEEDDILIGANLSSNALDSSPVISLFFEENETYYVDCQNWSVQEAYKAYGPNMKIYENFDFLNDYSGRIWIIDDGSNELYYYLKENYELTDLTETKYFYSEYHGSHTYSATLVEKNE